MTKEHDLSLSTLSLLSDSKKQEICLLNEGEEIPVTFKDFTKLYSWPNMGSLRKMAYESDSNGLAKAFIKFKKRRLVLPKTLFKLLKGGENADK